METPVIIAVVAVVLVLIAVLGFVAPRRRRRPPEVAQAPAPSVTAEPAPAVEVDEAPPATPVLEAPEPTAGRLVRLRARLVRSQSLLGKGLLSLLSRDHLDEDAWE